MSDAAGRYRRATAIFHAAAEREPRERAAYVSVACAGDGELERLVLEMLEADSRAEGFLERGPALELRPSAEPEQLPERIGPFRVVGLLGSGGMGRVYEAEQEEPARRVALKVLRPESFGRELEARFRHEAALLARLQHPGIAQVYAAGTEESAGAARPWMALELVRGKAIDEHARGLPLDERIELVARVADAVQHAHQRGIVHRDLKPANVLVDELGQPKVLDFGVAHVEQAELRSTLATRPGLIVGTLRTMSPEQAAAREDVDARTDVYSLGAIAYELLAGRPPLALEGLPLLEALRTLAEEEPPPLSAHDRRLAGELEDVVSKALAKERERRYASAAAFAADLRRILAGEPVEARPPSTLYLLSKLVRRHRGLAAGLALAALALALGLVAFVLQQRSTAIAERRAAAEARALAAIDGYLVQDLLGAPDPRLRGREVRVIDVLERAASGVDAAFATDPGTRARVRATLARSFLALGEHERAEREVKSALEWLRAQAGPRSPDTLEAESTLVEVLTARGRAAEGLPIAERALQAQREVLGPDHSVTNTTATNLASLLAELGRPAEAELLLREVIARRERLLGAAHIATLLARENLANVLAMQGRPEESLAERREALELRRAQHGERDAGTLLAWLHLARIEQALGQLAAPIATFEQLARAMSAVWGERHEHTLAARHYLATALERSDRSEEALDLLEAVLAEHAEVLGPSHPTTIECGLELAEALRRRGLAEASAELAEDCLARSEERPGPPLPRAVAHLVAGEAQLAAGNRERASELLRTATELLLQLDPALTPVASPYLMRARSGSAALGTR